MERGKETLPTIRREGKGSPPVAKRLVNAAGAAWWTVKNRLRRVGASLVSEVAEVAR